MNLGFVCDKGVLHTRVIRVFINGSGTVLVMGPGCVSIFVLDLGLLLLGKGRIIGLSILCFGQLVHLLNTIGVTVILGQVI